MLCEGRYCVGMKPSIARQRSAVCVAHLAAGAHCQEPRRSAAQAPGERRAVQLNACKGRHQLRLESLCCGERAMERVLWHVCSARPPPLHESSGALRHVARVCLCCCMRQPQSASVGLLRLPSRNSNFFLAKTSTLLGRGEGYSRNSNTQQVVGQKEGALFAFEWSASAHLLLLSWQLS